MAISGAPSPKTMVCTGATEKRWRCRDDGPDEIKPLVGRGCVVLDARVSDRKVRTDEENDLTEEKRMAHRKKKSLIVLYVLGVAVAESIEVRSVLVLQRCQTVVGLKNVLG